MADNTQTDADKKKTEAKEVAQKAPEATPKVKGSNGRVKAVVAVNLINGTIMPGTPFRPADAQELSDLESLNAVRDMTEAEAALFKTLEADAPASTNDDVLG